MVRQTNLTVVHIDDALDDGQPQAAATEGAGFLAPRERLQQQGNILFANALAMITDGQAHHVFHHSSTHLHRWRAVLECIADQVGEHPFYR